MHGTRRAWCWSRVVQHHLTSPALLHHCTRLPALHHCQCHHHHHCRRRCRRQRQFDTEGPFTQGGRKAVFTWVLRQPPPDVPPPSLSPGPRGGLVHSAPPPPRRRRRRRRRRPPSNSRDIFIRATSCRINVSRNKVRRQRRTQDFLKGKRNINF